MPPRSAPAHRTDRQQRRYVSANRAYVEAQVARLSPGSPRSTSKTALKPPRARWILWRNHAVAFDPAGQWTEAQSTGIDITERKRLRNSASCWSSMN
jgi:hypothetical protein